MLLTISTTHWPATDLGYLLHKNPSKVHSLELSFGKAHVFYPEASAEKCTAAVLLDVDPVGLVRGKKGQKDGGTLDQYVNDRPYVLSSFMSVAMGRMFGTAMTGRSKNRQELADRKIPLAATLTVVTSRGG
jgi:RNA repair, ligase-Pnkp-associating, region of Hen1